ncbi:MAG: alanine racemase [Mariprofundaceae bacterium]
MSRPLSAQINVTHLTDNYQRLQKQTSASQVMAVVKANAYGHGIEPVALSLAEAGCKSFAVTDTQEGVQLRELLRNKGKIGAIALLSGIFSAKDAETCQKHELTPVITTPLQVQWLTDAKFSHSIWLKIDTGMQRLGAEDVRSLLYCTQSKGIEVIGVMSHLACADIIDHPLNTKQINKFHDTVKVLDKDLYRSLLNSAAMITMPEEAMEVVRPGIALYGIEPVAEKQLGLKPVMTVKAGVLQVRHVNKGDSISYGASFHVDRTMRIAVVAFGYGDGLPRQLSNQGYAYAQGHRLPIVGRICMDYCMLDLGDTNINEGDWVEFWGEHISANDIATLAGTISYELFTGITQRVPRVLTHA